MKTECKFRGITLNHTASQLVNFDTIKFLVLNGRSNSIVTLRTIKWIKQNSGDGAYVTLVTEPEDKIYRISFSKKRRRDDNTSVPFGWK